MVWANGRNGDTEAARRARSASNRGEIVTRAGRVPPRPRLRRLSKLILVLAGLWPVWVHPITDSNTSEAGDGPLPVPGGMG
jgi:hypothetical protein